MFEPKLHLITCIGVDHELDLLPHFIEHYLTLGISNQRIHVVINASSLDSPGLVSAQSLLAHYGLPEPDIWIAPYTSETMWNRRREIQEARVPAEDWVVSADVDEFHEYGVALRDVVTLCEQYNADCVQGVFIDRISADGRLVSINEGQSLWAQFPILADVQNHLVERCSVGQYYGTVKMMLFKGYVFPGRGGHQPMQSERMPQYLLGRELGDFPDIGRARFRFAVPFRVHHFKWRETLVAGLERRLSTPGVSTAGASYGRALLDHFREHGAIDLSAIPQAQAGPRLSTDRGIARLRRMDRRHRARRKLRRRAQEIWRKFAE